MAVENYSQNPAPFDTDEADRIADTWDAIVSSSRLGELSVDGAYDLAEAAFRNPGGLVKRVAGRYDAPVDLDGMKADMVDMWREAMVLKKSSDYASAHDAAAIVKDEKRTMDVASWLGIPYSDVAEARRARLMGDPSAYNEMKSRIYAR